MKIIKGFIEQGDVCFFQTDKINKENPVKAKEKGFVLAEGEVTGHAHVIDRNAGIKLFQYGEELHIETSVAAPVKHEEHKTINLPEFVRGIVRIVKQYNPWTKLLKKTSD
jgi:hypothetical protein